MLTKTAGTENNLTALVRLHLFPRYVLAPMSRGGKRGRAQTRNILTKRLLAFRTSSPVDIIETLKTAQLAQKSRQLRKQLMTTRSNWSPFGAASRRSSQLAT